MHLNSGVGEDSWEALGQQGDLTSQSERKSTLNIHWKDWCWSWSSNTLAPDVKSWLVRKDPDAGKDWRQEEKGATEDEMVGWHHRLNGHEFGQALGDGEAQGKLACCNPWGRKESNRLSNWNLLSISPILGRISRQNYNSKRYMDPYVHSITIHDSQDMET